jgi:hypothetical protein
MTGTPGSSDTHTRALLFTEHHCLAADVATNGLRLSAVLNDPGSARLTLARVQVVHPGLGEEAVAAYPRGLLRKAAVQCALILAEPGRPPAHQLAARVSTTAMEVVVLLPSFRVAGRVHLRGRIEPIGYILDGAQAFLPLTAARLTHARGPAAPLAAEIALVNRSRIELVALAGE